MGELNIYNPLEWSKAAKITQSGAIKVTDMLDISAGKIDGVTHINKFGKNYDIDSGSVPETIWAKSGLYVPPTATRIHNATSTSANDVGSLVYTGIISSTSTLSNGNIIIIDSGATFISDGIAAGDKFLDDTAVDHTIIVSADSETQITIQPFHDGGTIAVNDAFRLVTATSTGAALLHIFGLDENGDQQKEFLILSGTSSATTVNSYLRINRCHTDLTGSNGANVGIIDLVAVTDGTSSAYIEVGDGQTLQAFYTVPNGKTAYVTSFNLSSHRVGSTQNAMVSCELRTTKFIPQGKIGIIEDTISVSLVGTSYTQKYYNPYKVFKQRTDLWLDIDYSTDNNMIVSGGFDIILIDNS